MAEVFQSVLQEAVNQWANTRWGKEEIQRYINDYVEQGGTVYDSSGRQIVTPKKIKELCQNLIDILQQEADSFFTISQQSILEHFKSLKYTNPIRTKEGYEAYVYFDDELWRPSLSDRYDGAYNIVGLFNKGWHISPSKRVWGYWQGHNTWLNQKIGSLLDKTFMPFCSAVFMTSPSSVTSSAKMTQETSERDATAITFMFDIIVIQALSAFALPITQLSRSPTYPPLTVRSG